MIKCFFNMVMHWEFLWFRLPCALWMFIFRIADLLIPFKFHECLEAMLATSTPASLGHQRSKCDFDWASAAHHCGRCSLQEGFQTHSLPGVGGRGRSPLIYIFSHEKIKPLRFHFYGFLYNPKTTYIYLPHVLQYSRHPRGLYLT